MIEAMVFFNGRKGYNKIASAIEGTVPVLLCHFLLTDTSQYPSQDAPHSFKINRGVLTAVERLPTEDSQPRTIESVTPAGPVVEAPGMRP